jgi:SnoaL-like domain
MTAEDRIAELEHRLGIVEDELAIRRLQHAYGYYLDKCYYDEVVDLFDEDCEVIFIGGVYKGRAGAARLYTGRSGHGSPTGTTGRSSAACSSTRCCRTSSASLPTGRPRSAATGR